jgi:F0F1-type ATP synthase assembly protein I
MTKIIYLKDKLKEKEKKEQKVLKEYKVHNKAEIDKAKVEQKQKNTVKDDILFGFVLGLLFGIFD